MKELNPTTGKFVNVNSVTYKRIKLDKDSYNSMSTKKAKTLSEFGSLLYTKPSEKFKNQFAVFYHIRTRYYFKSKMSHVNSFLKGFPISQGSNRILSKRTLNRLIEEKLSNVEQDFAGRTGYALERKTIPGAVNQIDVYVKNGSHKKILLKQTATLKYECLSSDVVYEENQCCASAIYNKYSSYLKTLSFDKIKYELSEIVKEGYECVYMTYRNLEDDAIIYHENKSKKIDSINEGVTVEVIEQWLANHKINWMFIDGTKQIISRCSKFSNHHLPNFYALIQNEHLYLIDSFPAFKEFEKKRAKHDFTRELVYVKKLNEIDMRKSVNYVVEKDCPYKDLATFIEEHNEAPISVKYDENEKLRCLMFERFAVYFSSDYRNIRRVLDKRNEELDEFVATEINNQYTPASSISTFFNLYLDYFGKQFIKSCPNEIGRDFMDKCLQRPPLFNSGESGEYCVDIVKCYLSILKGINGVHGFPIYSFDDEVVPYDGKLTVGMYQLSKEVVLWDLKLPKNVRIHADLVHKLLDMGKIKQSDIELQYKPSYVLPVDYFSDVIENLIADFPDLVCKSSVGSTDKTNGTLLWKSIINMFIGCLNKKVSKNYACLFTTSVFDLNEHFDNDITYERIGKYYPMKTCNVEQVTEVHTPIYATVISNAWVNIINLYEKIFEYNPDNIIIKVKTDSITTLYEPIDPSEYVEKGDDILITLGKYREDDVKQDGAVYSGVIVDDLMVKREKRNVQSLEAALESEEGFCLYGAPGTGKSYNLIKVIEWMKKNKKRFLMTSLAHVAVNNMMEKSGDNAFVLAKLFMAVGKYTTLKRMVEKYDYIIIDEFSQVTQYFYECVFILKQMGMKFILIGDSNQCPPPEGNDNSKEQHGRQLIRFQMTAFDQIVDYNYVHLTKVHRYDNELKAACENLLEGHLCKFNDSVEFLNPCYFNTKRDEINKFIVDKRMKTDSDYIKIGNMCLHKGQCYIICNNNKCKFANNQLMEVIDFDSDVVIRDVCTKKVFNVEQETIEFNFELAYAMTIYKSQGLTFDMPYAIHDIDSYRMNMNLVYTALSRATKKSQVSIIGKNYDKKIYAPFVNKYSCETLTGGKPCTFVNGFVYKLIENDKVVWVGETGNMKKRLEQHRQNVFKGRDIKMVEIAEIKSWNKYKRLEFEKRAIDYYSQVFKLENSNHNQEVVETKKTVKPEIKQPEFKCVDCPAKHQLAWKYTDINHKRKSISQRYKKVGKEKGIELLKQKVQIFLCTSEI